MLVDAGGGHQNAFVGTRAYFSSSGFDPEKEVRKRRKQEEEKDRKTVTKGERRMKMNQQEWDKVSGRIGGKKST